MCQGSCFSKWKLRKKQENNGIKPVNITDKLTNNQSQDPQVIIKKEMSANPNDDSVIKDINNEKSLEQEFGEILDKSNASQVLHSSQMSESKKNEQNKTVLHKRRLKKVNTKISNGVNSSRSNFIKQNQPENGDTLGVSNLYSVSERKASKNNLKRQEDFGTSSSRNKIKSKACLTKEDDCTLGLPKTERNVEGSYNNITNINFNFNNQNSKDAEVKELPKHNRAGDLNQVNVPNINIHRIQERESINPFDQSIINSNMNISTKVSRKVGSPQRSPTRSYNTRKGNFALKVDGVNYSNINMEEGLTSSNNIQLKKDNTTENWDNLSHVTNRTTNLPNKVQVSQMKENSLKIDNIFPVTTCDNGFEQRVSTNLDITNNSKTLLIQYSEPEPEIFRNIIVTDLDKVEDQQSNTSRFELSTTSRCQEVKKSTTLSLGDNLTDKSSAHIKLKNANLTNDNYSEEQSTREINPIVCIVSSQNAKQKSTFEKTSTDRSKSPLRESAESKSKNLSSKDSSIINKIITVIHEDSNEDTHMHDTGPKTPKQKSFEVINDIIENQSISEDSNDQVLSARMKDKDIEKSNLEKNFDRKLKLKRNKVKRYSSFLFDFEKFQNSLKELKIKRKVFFKMINEDNEEDTVLEKYIDLYKYWYEKLDDQMALISCNKNLSLIENNSDYKPPVFDPLNNKEHRELKKLAKLEINFGDRFLDLYCEQYKEGKFPKAQLKRKLHEANDEIKRIKCGQRRMTTLRSALVAKNKAFVSETFKSNWLEMETTREYLVDLLIHDHYENPVIISYVDSYNEQQKNIEECIDIYLLDIAVYETDQNNDIYGIKCQVLNEVNFATKFNDLFFNKYKKGRITFKRLKDHIKRLKNDLYNMNMNQKKCQAQKQEDSDRSQKTFDFKEYKKEINDFINTRKDLLIQIKESRGLDNNKVGDKIEIYATKLDDIQKSQEALITEQKNSLIEHFGMDNMRNEAINEITFAESFFEAVSYHRDLGKRGNIDKFMARVEGYLAELEYWDDYENVMN